MLKNKAVWACFCLLGFAVIGQFLFVGKNSKASVELPTDVLPSSLGGWQVRDLPLAETGLVLEAIEEGLGFDDYRFREFKRGNDHFVVYIAYWRPRQRHFMDLGTHAPDNCWVSNGWSMAPKLPKMQLEPAPNLKTWPAEHRIFYPKNSDIPYHVVYWHLLEGTPLDYSRYGTGKTLGFLLDNSKHYLRGTGLQYFIRISSNLSFDKLGVDPGFLEVIRNLGRFVPLVAPL